MTSSAEAPEGRVGSHPDETPLALPGLRTAAVSAGIKASGDLDVAVIDLGEPLTAAAVFTTNELCAPPVSECRERLAHDPRARAIVINSGNANAMTGARGTADAKAMLDRLEGHLDGPALVLSTGVIGVPLPLEQVLDGIDRAVERLAPDRGGEVARAMLTTDTRTKTSARQVLLPAADGDAERSVTVRGVAKGSGMIHPHMATMLAVIVTDAPLEPAAADRMLREAVDTSFHTITVDGDTSTNDAVLLLAGGAEMPTPTDHGPREVLLAQAVREVAEDLALAIVRDGEGASRIARISVTGARSHDEARQVARSIACSSLVKTALAGGDPNWGRILSAAANAGVGLDGDRLRLLLGEVEVFAGGLPTDYDQAAADRAFSQDEVDVLLELDLGDEAATMYTTDLTKGYVEINSEYTT